MPIDLSSTEVEEIRRSIYRHVPGAQIALYGSRAKGLAKRFSDVDLLIDAGRPLTGEERFLMMDALSLSDLPYRVDLVDVHKSNADFLRSVLPGSIPL